MRVFLTLIFLSLSFLLVAQHQDKVDFTQGEIRITPFPKQKKIVGTVVYTFDVLEKVDSVFLDAQNMLFSEVRLNGRKIKFSNNTRTISIHKKFKKGRAYKLTLGFTAYPKQTVYFLGWDTSTALSATPYENIEGQIWTQGQGKYTSHWVPSFDAMEEKVEFDLSITFEKGYTVIANGKLVDTEEIDGRAIWNFDMKSPMSSYLLAFAIGHYDKQKLRAASGIPITNYYYPRDSAKVEATYRYTAALFDFLEAEIGVPYPWQNYKQVPVRDFLYAGMENTGTTVFSDAYVIDSIAFSDKNYVTVNAHEMAHQWFGNLVTEKNGNHHWLHEGFATYYSYLAEKEIFGEAHFYWKLYDTAKQLDRISKKGEGEALTDPKASSLTFYEKGAWALHMLREQLGEETFKKGIVSFLNKYRFGSSTIPEFIFEMEQASGQELDTFTDTWLKATTFPFDKAKEHLMESSKELESFFKLKWELTTSLDSKPEIIQRYWGQTDSEEMRARIIQAYYKSVPIDFLKETFNSGSMKIRQALATSFDKVPIELKQEFETLLGDPSYRTIENALYRLWVSFPKDRVHYLEQTKNIVGLPNRNVRLLWLLFAVLTKDYASDTQLKAYWSELSGYTGPRYAPDIRHGAFDLVHRVLEFSDQNLLDLIDASEHHSWQFQKFARTLLDQFLQDDKQRKRLESLVKGLKEGEYRYIKNKLQQL